MNPLLLAVALVWLPPETFMQWSKIDGLLRARPELKLTIALTPPMATPLVKDALAPWVKTGRVEIAARIPGDPVLPLVAADPSAPRPDDALELAAEALRSIEKRLAANPTGFIPGTGALDPALVGPIGAVGTAWVLAGPYAVVGDSWAAEGGTVFVPARAAPLQAPVDANSSGALVVDESAQPESVFVAAMTAPPRVRPIRGWATVSELVATQKNRTSAESVAAWPGWNGIPATTPVDSSARAAYDAYLDAAKTLARYRDSGAADLKILESAAALLRQAQEARFFRAPEPGAPAGLPPELRAHLMAVYKRIKLPAPASLYAVSASTAVVDLPTGVHTVSSATWISFDNPLGTIARAPAGAANADPWRLRGLRVEWDDDRVLFRISPARVDALPPAPRPVYDVYIDLNHIVGAGAIRLLEGRGAFAQARDAWEFALTLAGSTARLYQAGADGGPEEIAPADVELDPANAEIRVSVLRESLRGSPARWGYILLALAEDPARPDRAPAAILVGPDGAQTLGLLAPVEIQKTVLDHPGTPQRVAAARLDGNFK